MPLTQKARNAILFLREHGPNWFTADECPIEITPQLLVSLAKQGFLSHRDSPLGARFVEWKITPKADEVRGDGPMKDKKRKEKTELIFPSKEFEGRRIHISGPRFKGSFYNGRI